MLGDDEIRHVLTRGRERGDAVGRSENVIAVALKHPEQRGPSSFIVIGNQDAAQGIRISRSFPGPKRYSKPVASVKLFVASECTRTPRLPQGSRKLIADDSDESISRGEVWSGADDPARASIFAEGAEGCP